MTRTIKRLNPRCENCGWFLLALHKWETEYDGVLKWTMRYTTCNHCGKLNVLSNPGV